MVDTIPGRSHGTKPVLPFLVGYFLAYAVIATLINVVYGPPSMSGEFLDQYKEEYERYVETSKDPAYRKWQQRPHLNPPDDALQARIDFMREFGDNEDLRAELARRERYDLILDFFNVFMVGLLIVRFARKPVANLLDDIAQKTARKLDDAAAAREEAVRREARAAEQRRRLDVEKERIDVATQGRISDMERDMRALTEKRLEALEQETEDRKNQQEALALQALKRALVSQAVEELIASAWETDDQTQHLALLDDFIERLELESRA